jgi:multiple sugar transport system substrate-binding protein
MATQCRRSVALLAAALAAAPATASPEGLTLWMRDNGATVAARVIEHWNETHPADPITLTLIPHERMMAAFASATASGAVPDLLSLDLILMPDFMKAGYLKDITDPMSGNPNVMRVVPAHIALATYEKRLYGVPFTPDDSILLYNKALFRKAGLDAERPPTTTGEIVSAARKIRSLGPDYYGLYFSGACPGCNIFTLAPQMWAARGTVVLPAGCDAEPLQGESIKQVLQDYRTMWKERLIPEQAKDDPGDHYSAVFRSGKVGMQAGANYAVALVKEKAPDLDFGVAFLPGPRPGDVSSFAGGDVLTIPAAAKHGAKALEFLEWVLTDEPQLEVYAKTGNLPSRTDLTNNKYFRADPRLTRTAEALAVAQTPWTFHFHEMSNDDRSPWIEMVRTAIFEGDVDGAIARAKTRMKQIQCDAPVPLSGSDPLAQAAAGFDNLFLHDECTAPYPPQPDTCLHERVHQQSFAFGGKAGAVYDVTLRVRGIFEPTTITGGETPDGQHPYFKVGGSVGTPDWSRWEIEVSEPRQTYWLNHYPSVGHTIYKEDFEATVTVAAGATVVIRVTDGNDRQIDNGKSGPDRQQVIAGVVDHPLPGQMLRLDVVRVRQR